MVTVYSKVIAKEEDSFGYKTLVLENLDNAPFGHKYCMLTVLPNWQSKIPELGEIGYTTYNEVIAGIDKWFCPETGQMIPYNYTNIYFIKFVKKPDNLNKDIII